MWRSADGFGFGLEVGVIGFRAKWLWRGLSDIQDDGHFKAGLQSRWKVLLDWTHNLDT